MIRITSRRDGYWRAGLQHFRSGLVHDEADLTDEQVKMLEGDPALVIEKDVKEQPEPSDPEDEEAAIAAAIRTLGVVDFDGSGKPRMPALRTAIKAENPALAARLDIALRDRVFAAMLDAEFVAPTAAPPVT